MSDGPALMLISGVDPSDPGGGHHDYVRAHALAAVAAGFAPQIFCVAARDGRRTCEYGTVHLVAAPRHGNYRAAITHRRALTRAAVRYADSLDDPGPHVLHSFGAWAGCGVSVAAQLARRGIAVSVLASAFTTLDHEHRAKVRALGRHHGLREHLRYGLRYAWIHAVSGPAEHRGYSRSELVLVNYESVRRLLANACNPCPPIRVIAYASTAAFEDSNGASVGALDALAGLGQPDAPLIVCVARQDPRKGIDVLFTALSGLRDRSIPFRACIIGKGPLLDAHRRLAAELAITDQVSIPGHVEDVLPYLTKADIFVLPSLAEGSGSIAVLEALQTATAIVASRCDGIPEDLSDGEDALLVTPGDAPELEAALARLATDARLREELSLAARQTFETRFSAEVFTRELAEVYAACASLAQTFV
jgi:glycosyltransferase involved in cell wall biosynthesis